ncbi:hypothetical protein A3A01_01515 [Candidatus Nomurabacteria bacterium RIFCSPLOWO2_01_FULL_39_17]|uniref:Cytidyltransferase-like domain-containing protein n=1 Tax=Candidatus Nomurabacteria bacterium RIFCSPLOWO2_01_FULL_39_17 TaxID=1801770 RepID=A0A1F6WW14_9BACT|nr:MAG: hypothetical protein A3A01_01515 [Candidatus Nomurabacteria bacterium RIFCSPLOWO2_01_FULL_39_17]
MGKTRTKIMVFGTFDGLHQGHLDFFRQAKKLSKRSFLIASISRDKNVYKIKKVRPIFSEKQRAILTKKCKLVNRVVLAGIKNHLPHILKERPDIIALGYDQRNYTKSLKKDLKNKGLVVNIVRLKPYKKHTFKNHLLKNRR